MKPMALREFTIRPSGQCGGPSKVVGSIFRPSNDKETGGSWTCLVTVADDTGRILTQRSYGEDTLQAISLAVALLDVLVEAYQKQTGLVVEWLGVAYLSL